MPKISFSKMHGNGNDFIIIDAIRQKLPRDLPAAYLADRRAGIGCDQILILQAAPRYSPADFIYRIINADGSEVGQCGNGARCAHAFLRQQKITRKKHLRLHTSHTSIVTESIDKNTVRAYLALPQFSPAQIPLKQDNARLWHRASKTQAGIELPARFCALSLGNPHAVFFVSDDKNLIAVGKALNHAPQLFPDGVNVSFCRRRKNHVTARVYERGVGETDSCGSAAVAAAVTLIRNYGVASPITVAMSGGELLCGWAGGENAAWLQGGVNFVFDGIVRW